MGGGKGTSKSTQAPPKEIMDAYKQSLDLGRQAIQQPYQQYQGQLVAGMNPTQLQGMANVNAAQGAALPYIQQGAAYTNQAAQGVNPQMINQFMSPYLNNVVGATQKNLLESNAQQLAGLKGQAIQSGAFGGDRSRFAQAELARQQGLAGGQVIGGLLNQGYGQALAGAQQNVQNMMQGGQQLGGMGQAAQQSILQGAQAQMAAGAQQQATEQTFLQSAYDQFLQRQAYPYQQAQFFANIAQGIGAGAGGTTSQTPAAPNPFSQALGAITAIGTFAPSDERMKENIKPVGKTNDGQTIYKYNFKGSPKTEIGLIAQEVEKKNPDAVADFGGIKMVNYDAATEGSERTGKAFGGSSMGGLVTPGMEREAFAQGGFGMVPYADFMKGLSYIPEGKMSGQSPGSTFPSGYKMEELQRMAEGSSFDELNAMSAKDIDKFQQGLGNIGKKMGISPINDGADGLRAPTYSGSLSSFGPGVTNFFSGVGTALGFADGGGVVPRHGYQTDGAVREEGALPPFLVEAESGGNFAADNDLGYVGRGQFGEARLTDAKRAGVIPPDMTQEQFKNDPSVQQAVEKWHAQDIGNFIQDRGLGSFVGKEINGVPVTPQGLLSVAHLGGKGGMEKFLKSGGRYNPADANGTSLMDYLALAAGTEGGVIPVNQDPAATEMPPAGVVPTDLPEMPPAGVVPAVEGDFQAKYSPTGVVAPTADEEPATGEEPSRRRSIIESILGEDMSDQARTGMLAAGLAMMGGTSPYFGVNVGKGGLTGLQTYYKGLENQRETAVKAADIQKALSEARSTQATAGGTEQALLNNVKNEYLVEAFKYKKAGKEYPSWSDFLKARGFSDRGWEAFDPTIIMEKTPAATTTSLDEIDTGAPTSDVPAQTSTGTEEGTEQGAATPAASRLPSAVIQPGNQSLNIPDTLPDNNPYFLSLDPSKAERFNKLMEQGWTTDINGNKVTLPFSKAEIDNAVKLNNETTSNFAEVQKRLPVNKNIANQIVEVLQKNPSGSLTTLKGQLAGIWAATPFGSEEDVSRATAADLLTKLYGQLAVGSEVQGSATNAGSEKIKQVATSLGGPNIQPSASREIMGTTLGAISWQEDMVKDWGRFLDKHRVTGISERMRNEFIEGWNNKLDKYVEQSIKQTPVKGELNWNAGKTKLKLSGVGRPKKGYQYITPDGEKVNWNGEKFITIGEEQ